MKIHILGTGTSQGVPVIGCDCEVCTSSDVRDHRLRSCVVIEEAGQFILIDTGPDLRQQMLRGDIPRIDAILYTHEHNDHVIGLDDIRPYNFSQKSDMHMYGLPRVMNEITRRFDYAFGSSSYPGAPKAVAHEISGDSTLTVAGFKITPIHVIHGRLQILGYRVGAMAFITDGSKIDDTEMAKLQGLDVLVINALRHRQHPSHFNLEEALEVIRVLDPGRAIITHVSHYMGLYEEWSALLPPDVTASYDGMIIEI